MSSSFNGMGNVKTPKVSPKNKPAPIKQQQKPNTSKGAIDSVKTDRGDFKFKNHNMKSKDCQS